MSTPNIIYYHYAFSPYGRKVFWYLKLRAIPFTQCVQPMVLPRPDLELLGITYRRIPLLAIDGDVYADTRLIIQTLEERFPETLPNAVLGPGGAAGSAWARLLEDWSDNVFLNVLRLLPSDLPVLKDEKFLKDRRDFSGNPGAFDAAVMEKGRPEALAQIRNYFHFVEHSLLSGNKKWVLGGDSPSPADIMAIFTLDWALTMPNTLLSPPTSTSTTPLNLFTSSTYPSIHDWHARFKALLKTPTLPNPPSILGPAARDIILSSPQPTLKFDTQEPLGLAKNEWVLVTPTNTGRSFPQRGRLVGLDVGEVVVEVEVEVDGGDQGKKKVRVHFPRLGYSIK
ncbi:hypothetical protein DFH27DRAFT_502126, partial [Peziza echinospora]